VQPAWMKVRSVSGTPIKVVGERVLKVKAQGHEADIKFVVCQGICENVVIGNSDMDKLGFRSAAPEVQKKLDVRMVQVDKRPFNEVVKGLKTDVKVECEGKKGVKGLISFKPAKVFRREPKENRVNEKEGKSASPASSVSVASEFERNVRPSKTEWVSFAKVDAKGDSFLRVEGTWQSLNCRTRGHVTRRC